MSKPIKVKVDASKEKDYSIKSLIIDACDSFDNDFDWGEDGDNYDKDDKWLFCLHRPHRKYKQTYTKRCMMDC